MDEKESKENQNNNPIRLFFQRQGAYISSALIDFKRSPMTIFFTVAYPIILILLFGAIFSGNGAANATYTLYYQSGIDNGYEIAPSVTLNFTQDIITIFQEMKRNDSSLLFDMKAIPELDEENNPIDPGIYLEEQSGYIALLIPDNFTQEVLFNSPVNITLIVDPNS
ncbi:MAG: hypothetical protein ACFFDW_17430, partial [Candidatus Thorarchaeota archaeon]